MDDKTLLRALDLLGGRLAQEMISNALILADAQIKQEAKEAEMLNMEDEEHEVQS